MNWKTQRPAEREFTKILCNHITIYKENGKEYFVINNASLTDEQRKIISSYIKNR